MIFKNETKKQSHENQTTQMVWRQMQFAVKSLWQSLQVGNEEPADFVLAHEALQRLPISQDEFALAKSRLHNAETYCGCGETGAAGYELKLLYGVIRRESECPKTHQQVKSLS